MHAPGDPALSNPCLAKVLAASFTSLKRKQSSPAAVGESTPSWMGCGNIAFVLAVVCFQHTNPKYLLPFFWPLPRSSQ